VSFDKRVEFVFLFDVKDGNPNGDPDAGNAPRVDPENGYGFVTDVCLKRKIRNFVALTKGCEPPNDIYVKERGILAVEQRKAYKAINAEPDSKGPNEAARKWMCTNYFDVRTFGAVMTTGKAAAEETESGSGAGARARSQKRETKLWNCGQVRGPVQMSFARSQSRILSLENAITRVALTNPDDTGRAGSADEEKAASGQIGRKYTVPYALYRAHGYLSPFLARDTGFTEADYELLLESVEHMFDNDRSAARGEMAVRGLGVFEHESALGNAPAHKLFDLIEITGPETPRSFTEYSVTDAPATPSGVTFRCFFSPHDRVQ
jgi:CRISPR-associated protein Csd2